MKVYSVNEVSKLIGFPGRTINRWIQAKMVGAIRAPSPSAKNQRYYIRHADLLKLAERLGMPDVVAKLKRVKQ